MAICRKVTFVWTQTRLCASRDDNAWPLIFKHIVVDFEHIHVEKVVGSVVTESDGAREERRVRCVIAVGRVG